MNGSQKTELNVVHRIKMSDKNITMPPKRRPRAPPRWSLTKVEYLRLKKELETLKNRVKTSVRPKAKPKRDPRFL